MIETPKWEGWWVFLLGKEIGSILSILFCDMFEDIRKVSGAVAVRLPEQQYLFFTGIRYFCFVQWTCSEMNVKLISSGVF